MAKAKWLGSFQNQGMEEVHGRRVDK